MAQTELLDENAQLKVRLGLATKEIELLNQKVKLSQETANRWEGKYAEFKEVQNEIAARNSKLHASHEEIFLQQEKAIKEQAELIQGQELLLGEKDQVMRQLTDMIKEERVKSKGTENEMKELRGRLAALERHPSEDAKSDLSAESLYNPQSYDPMQEEESKEPRGAASTAQTSKGRFSCLQCDLRFDSRIMKEKHQKSKEH